MTKSGMKLITLVLPPGKGFPVLEHLHKSGLLTSNLHHARGSFVGLHDKKGRPVQTEQEVVTCILKDDEAEHWFEELHNFAGFDKPNPGFMYMESLKACSNYSLPTV